MKVLVTGAGGYLAEALCYRLSDLGFEVRAMYRSSFNPDLESYKNIEVVKADLMKPDQLESAIKGVDQIYHVAAFANNWAKDLSVFYKVNIGGSLNLIKIAQKHGVNKIVVTSSAGTIGPCPDWEGMVTEDGYRDIHFFGDYESSKFILDEKIQHIVRKDNMDIRIVCPTRIFGPGKMDGKSNLISNILNKYRLGTWRFKMGDGNDRGCYAFIDDVVEGHVLAMKNGKAGEKYLIGSFNTTFMGLLNEVDQVTGNHPKKLVPVPFWLLGAAAGIMETLSGWFKFDPVITKDWIIKLQQNWYTDTSKAQDELGFVPTSKEESVRKTIDWLKTL